MTDKTSVPGVWIYIYEEDLFTKSEQKQLIRMIGHHKDFIFNVLQDDEEDAVRTFEIQGESFTYGCKVSLYKERIMWLVETKIELNS